MIVTVVIPTYNERRNVSLLIPRIFSVMDKLHLEGNVIVVDDNSPDGTAEEVRKSSKLYSVFAVERKGRGGLGSAYVDGFKEALRTDTDIIFEMDGDLSHNPAYIPDFIKRIEDGYDVVVGSRLEKGGDAAGWSLRRRLISRCGNIIGRLVAGIDVSDLTSGYRAYRSHVLRAIDLGSLKSRSYDFQLEILRRVMDRGFRVGTIPIVFTNRKFGKSKLLTIDMLQFILTALRIRLRLVR